MRDMHCHILPGVDDGARDLNESLAMLDAARQAGVTSIVCTPALPRPVFRLRCHVGRLRAVGCPCGRVPPHHGFEVNHSKLMDLGWSGSIGSASTGRASFLLELSTRARKPEFEVYERTIFELQGKGYQVIIAHPERYRAIQEDVEGGASAGEDGVASCRPRPTSWPGGRMGAERKPAKRLFEENLYSYIASDAPPG